MTDTWNSTNSTTVVASAATRNQQYHGQFEKTTMWYAVAVLLFLMIIPIVFGNTLVLISTWRYKRLHQPNKYFIACLAVADLLVGIISIPFRLYMHFNHLVKIEVCQIWLWIHVSCEIASIITLMVIGIDRYFKISMPFKYKTQMTTSRSLILIFFIWLIPSSFSTFSIISLMANSELVIAVRCSYRNNVSDHVTIALGVFFFAPTLIIIATYTAIFYIAHKRQKMARNGALGESFENNQSRRKALFQDLKIIRMLSLVVFTFIVCWSPFFTLIFLWIYERDFIVTSRTVLEIVLYILSLILPMFNSLCNPVIYACFDREYSKAFKLLFQQMLSMKISSTNGSCRQAACIQTDHLKEISGNNETISSVSYRKRSNKQNPSSNVEGSKLAVALFQSPPHRNTHL